MFITLPNIAHHKNCSFITHLFVYDSSANRMHEPRSEAESETKLCGIRVADTRSHNLTGNSSQIMGSSICHSNTAQFRSLEMQWGEGEITLSERSKGVILHTKNKRNCTWLGR